MSIRDEHSPTQINANASAGVGQTLLIYTDLNCLIFRTDCSLVLFRHPQKSPAPQVIWLQETLNSLFSKKFIALMFEENVKFFFAKETKTNKQTNPQQTQNQPRQLRVPYA